MPGKSGEEREKVIAPWNIYDLSEFKNRRITPAKIIGERNKKSKKKVTIQLNQSETEKSPIAKLPTTILSGMQHIEEIVQEVDKMIKDENRYLDS